MYFVFSLVFLIVCAYFRYCRAGRLMAKIPGPTRVLLLGHTFAMHKNPEQFFVHLRIYRKRYGRPWRLDEAYTRSVHMYHPDGVKGHDTTATALTFILMSIANEPEIQDSICEELHGIYSYGDSQRLPTIEDLSQMKYLECCIKESLRLYPSVPLIARYLTEEVDIAGYRIPKHTIVNIHVFDSHRDPVVYPEPEKFRPERFLPAAERN